jgi:Raf kinase inhibitor-like YbhB/YbcL family protein
MAFQVRVPAFREGDPIPKRHTCEGQDLSPAVEWAGAPPHTKSFALILDDPDAPMGVWNHWLLWDIPSDRTSIPEGFKPGDFGVSGNSDFGKPGYGGPCPPKGHGPHRYYFKLFALAVERLGLKAGARRAELDRAIKPHITAESWAMGRCERK